MAVQSLHLWKGKQPRLLAVLLAAAVVGTACGGLQQDLTLQLELEQENQ
jgi:hypothetical protein